MPNLEDTVKRLTSGFEVERKSSGSRTRVVGTKKLGFFETDQRVFVCITETAHSTKDLDWFFKEAEKFCEDNQRYDIVGIYFVSPAEVDKDQFKSLLGRTADRVAKRIKPPRMFDLAAQQPPPATAPPVAIENGTSGRRPELSDARLGARGEHERMLYEWEMVYSEASRPPVPAIVGVTQERCVLFRRVESDILAMGVEIKWDTVTNVEAGVLAGSPVVNINDGKKIHHLHHTDAPYIARLIHHLQWVRRGYLTGFSDIYGWDTGLRDAVDSDLISKNYSAALWKGFTHVESEIRQRCNLPDGSQTRDTLNKAFNPSTGLLSFGRNQGEREGLHNFVIGAFALYRNPVSHGAESESLDLNETIQALNVANVLIRLLERGQEAARQRPLIRPHDETQESKGNSAAGSS